jgi:hypothetical protein
MKRAHWAYRRSRVHAERRVLGLCGALVEPLDTEPLDAEWPFAEPLEDLV